MNFDEFVTTTTNNELAPAVIDTVLGGNVLTSMIMSKPKQWRGRQQSVTVKVSQSGAGGSFTGYDLFSTSRANTRQEMQFAPKGYYQSVVMSNMEVAVNETPAQALSLVAVEMESSQEDMIDGIGDLFYGDGTGNGSKDFTGLAAAVDDGSVAATYGGLSRSTYTSLQSNVTTGVGNITLSAMATMYDSCRVGSDRPDLIVTTETVWTYYESLLSPTVVANYQAQGRPMVGRDGIMSPADGLQGQAGFQTLMFRGTPVVADEKCTAGYMYFLNLKYIHWYALKHPKHSAMNADRGLTEGASDDYGVPVIYWTGLKEPVNQDAGIGQFIIYGELINRNPNRSGVLQGITGV